MFSSVVHVRSLAIGVDLETCDAKDWTVHDVIFGDDWPLAKDVGDSFGLDPDSFPKIITSKSPKNMGGGYLGSKRTIREVKVDAVQRALEQLTAPEADDSVEINEQMARFAALIKRAGD